MTIEIDELFKEDLRSVVMNRLKMIPGIGCVMALLSGFFFATASFTVEVSGGVDPAFIVTTRSLMQVVFFLPLVIFFKEPMHGVDGERLALLERSVFGYTCFVLSYYALDYISLTDSSAIIFSAPVFTAVLACIFLKEPCGVFHIITIIITVIGVFMISRPSFLFDVDTMTDAFTVEERLIGIILCLFCLLAISYTYISMRKLQKTPTNAVITFFSIFCVCAGSITMNVSSFISGKTIVLPETAFQWLMIMVNGLCGSLAQATLVLSLKLEEAGLVSLLRTFDIVVAFFFQAVFLDQPIHWTSILGSAIVCTGCIAVGLKKVWESKNVAVSEIKLEADDNCTAKA
jgi:drug/metabolite transporter (DMT)-like permease